jgi:hypothetical protein
MKTPTAMSKPFPKLKSDPMGNCFDSLGADGVLRVYDFDSFEVIDAARLSTAQIKQFLDRLPFDQAKEDQFRGVDGRGVPDEHMFNPPEDIRPKRPSEEILQEHRRLIEELRRKEVKKDSKAVCKGGNRSNYNLDPI